MHYAINRRGIAWFYFLAHYNRLAGTRQEIPYWTTDTLRGVLIDMILPNRTLFQFFVVELLQWILNFKRSAISLVSRRLSGH